MTQHPACGLVSFVVLDNLMQLVEDGFSAEEYAIAKAEMCAAQSLRKHYVAKVVVKVDPKIPTTKVTDLLDADSDN